MIKAFEIDFSYEKMIGISLEYTECKGFSAYLFDKLSQN